MMNWKSSFVIFNLYTYPISKIHVCFYSNLLKSIISMHQCVNFSSNKFRLKSSSCNISEHVSRVSCLLPWDFLRERIPICEDWIESGSRNLTGAANKSIFLPLIRMSPTALALVPKSPVDFYCFRIATEPVHGNLDTLSILVSAPLPNTFEEWNCFGSGYGFFDV